MVNHSTRSLFPLEDRSPVRTPLHPTLSSRTLGPGSRSHVLKSLPLSEQDTLDHTGPKKKVNEAFLYDLGVPFPVGPSSSHEGGLPSVLDPTPVPFSKVTVTSETKNSGSRGDLRSLPTFSSVATVPSHPPDPHRVLLSCDPL